MIAHRLTLATGRLEVRFTERTDGDFAVGQTGDDLEHRRADIVDAPWTWLRQVHGDTVVIAEEPGAHAGIEADGAITTGFGVPISVTTADCAPVVLVATAGVAVVHAGWRGAAAGIIEQAAAALGGIAGPPVATLVGPCIQPRAYAFGAEDLDRLAGHFGDGVRATTASGEPALDLPALVAVSCRRAGWPQPRMVGGCTSAPQFFSHRHRGDRERQTTVAWLVPESETAGS